MSWLQDKIDENDNPAAPTTPSRAIGAAFQPSASKYVLGQYTINLVCAHGETSLVTLLSDAANPPTTQRTSARLKVTDDAAAVEARQQLSYLVPPGHYVKFVASGSPGTAATISDQVETQVT